MRTLFVLLIPALFLPVRVDALTARPRQATNGSAQTVQRRGEDGRLEVWAATTQDPVRVDGRLDDPIWRQAEPAGGFVQAEPLEGQPASEQTAVWVAFDQDHLYIAAFCYDRQP
ncbi:MAG: hypothetical protein HY701_06620, partial [Gemmatimonadetes bacterium]|nr:hypothetical protein [Gemmatimonadota bacterium]